jgi:hypothetical protein
LRRRLLTATAWPVGVTFTSWHYFWRTTPIHRRELAGSPDDHPPSIPTTLAHEELQEPGDGVGPLFRRRYTAHVRDAELSAQQLIARVGGDPNRASPTGFARFQKVRGDEGVLRVGDEYVVRMPGPWDGPVRVADVTPTSFRLATLAGHLEAGQIEFRAFPAAGGDLCFQIESWARSGDRLSNLLYHHLRMSKEVQLHMWTSFVEQAAGLAGGSLADGIDIETRRLDDVRAVA